METDPWLTVEQVAERLQYHQDTVRRLLRAGKLQGYRQTRRGGWRIRASAVDHYVMADWADAPAPTNPGVSQPHE